MFQKINRPGYGTIMAHLMNGVCQSHNHGYETSKHAIVKLMITLSLFWIN